MTPERLMRLLIDHCDPMIRKSHFMGSSEAARWTIDPSTYWKESDSKDEVVDKIVLLCENVVRTCDHFEVSNHVS